MQVIIKATSSMLNATTVLIETATTIGENTTTQRVGYDVQELTDNRYMTGDLEARIEQLRQSAEAMTESSVRAHFEFLVKNHKAIREGAETVLAVEPAPVKKTRAKRQPKATVAAEQE